MRNWKPGDTRTEFAAILNIFSGFVLLGVSAAGAWVAHTVTSVKREGALQKELRKVQEYKEQMYFDAVQEILTKLADSKLKGSTKARLQRDLKDVDPDGTITAFLQEGGSRPDLSDRIGKKTSDQNKVARKLKRPAEKPGASRAFQKRKIDENDDTDSTVNDDDEGDDNDDDDDNNNKKEVSPPPRAKGAEKSLSKSAAPSERSLSNDKGTSNISSSSESELFKELNESLRLEMTETTRNSLLKLLQDKLNGISNPEKRSAVTLKIAERLGDSEYWLIYAKKMGLGL